MRTTLEQIGQLRYRLEAEWDQGTYRKERDKLAKEYASQIEIKGFRAGKAPPELIIQRLGKEFTQVLHYRLIREAFNKILEERKLKVSLYKDPEINEATPESPFTFTMEFEVYPDIVPKNYLGLEIEEVTLPEISDKEIDQAIEQLRESSARWEPSDGVACEGDYAGIEYKIIDLDTGKEGEIISGNLKVGLDDVPIRDFGRHLLGMKAGDEKEVEGEYTLGEWVKDDKVGGEKRSVKVWFKVKEILKKRLPELNDEFAREQSGGLTLSEWREEVRKKLEKGREKTIRNILREKVIDALIEANPMEIGEETVKQLAKETEEYAKERIMSGFKHIQGIDKLIDDLGYSGKAALEKASRELKKNYLLEKIAELEGIRLDDDEIEDFLKRTAEESDIPVSKLREKIYSPEGEDLLKRLLLEKTLEMLMRYAYVVQKSEKKEKENNGIIEQASQDKPAQQKVEEEAIEDEQVSESSSKQQDDSKEVMNT